MKIIAKIELSNVDQWETDFDNDYEKREAFDELTRDMKHSISQGCGIYYQDISIELKLEK